MLLASSGKRREKRREKVVVVWLVTHPPFCTAAHQTACTGFESLSTAECTWAPSCTRQEHNHKSAVHPRGMDLSLQKVDTKKYMISCPVAEEKKMCVVAKRVECGEKVRLVYTRVLWKCYYHPEFYSSGGPTEYLKSQETGRV